MPPPDGMMACWWRDCTNGNYQKDDQVSYYTLNKRALPTVSSHVGKTGIQELDINVKVAVQKRRAAAGKSPTCFALPIRQLKDSLHLVSTALVISCILSSGQTSYTSCFLIRSRHFKLMSRNPPRRAIGPLVFVYSTGKLYTFTWTQFDKGSVQDLLQAFRKVVRITIQPFEWDTH
jgi:hypothetical protein